MYKKIKKKKKTPYGVEMHLALQNMMPSNITEALCNSVNPIHGF